jgi:hypothetical protein
MIWSDGYELCDELLAEAGKKCACPGQTLTTCRRREAETAPLARNQTRTLFAVPPAFYNVSSFTTANRKARGIFAHQFQHCGCTSRFLRGGQSPRDIC